jgi:hypothetical protein
MKKLLSHPKRYYRWIANKRNFKRMMKETFVEEIVTPMPWWGWVITGIGLIVIIYASINY